MQIGTLVREAMTVRVVDCRRDNLPLSCNSSDGKQSNENM